MVCKMMIDTHYYDGKLWSEFSGSPQDIIRDRQSKAKLLSEIDRASIIPNKVEMFRNLQEFLSQNEQTKDYRTARACLNTIINDSLSDRRGSGPNYDPKNNLHAEDLLYLCAEKILDENFKSRDDFIFIFMIQCEDMRTGMCPQGRTTRLFQTLMMMLDNK